MYEVTNMVQIIQGEALEVLKSMDSESINCIVTSPPYWGLRNYNNDLQLGMESTFEEYILKLCNIFDEIKRVLKNDGTCFVNLGDTYSGTGNKKDWKDPKYKDGRNGQVIAVNNKTSVQNKSLCCIPDRFKIEMVTRGWICRNELIWHKKNAMPSSAKDRFTVDYEKVFFFVKSKKYYFDTQYEELQGNHKDRLRQKRTGNKTQKYSSINNSTHSGGVGYSENGMRVKRCVWAINTKPLKDAHFASYPTELIEPMIKAGCPIGGVVLDPFIGSGTTALVSTSQNKKCIGIELNPEYIEIAKKRLIIPTL